MSSISKKEQQEAQERLDAKRQVRQQRSRERSEIVSKIEALQDELKAFDETTTIECDMASIRMGRQQQVRRATEAYNKAVEDAVPILAEASNKPGQMTREEEQAQNDIVSAYTAFEEITGGWTEIDEIES